MRRRGVAWALIWIMPAQGVWAAAPPPAPAATRRAPAPEESAAAPQPILECVVENGPGSFTAHFGYVNRSDGAVGIPLGAGNLVAPGPPDRGQPTRFEPGRTPRYPHAAFHADFDGRELTWSLRATDGTLRTASASASSRRCETQAGDAPPRLRVLEPAGGASLASETPRLRLAYDDDGAIDRGSLRVTLDGVDRTAWFTVGAKEAVAAPDVKRALPQGRHTLQATVKDDGGRTGSASVSFEVDTQAPQVEVITPAAGTFESADAVDVTGTVLDAAPVRVTVGGRDAVVRSGIFKAVGVPLGAGPQAVLPIVARDAAGNTATSSLKLRVERRPPALRIESPAPGSPVKGPIVHVTGSVEGAAGPEEKAAEPAVSVEVNGRPALVEGGRFSVDVPVGKDGGSLEAVARNEAGLSATATTFVTVDAHAPELSVDSPLPGTVTRERSLGVTGRVDDKSAQVLVNGQPASLDGGVFRATVPLGEEGARTILVRSRDAAGNVGQVEIPVRVDRTPPTLRLGIPEGATVDGRAAVVGTAEDGGAVSVSVNGESADRLDRAWRVKLDTLPPGRHVLEAVARDEAGNETRIKHVVNVAPPTGPVVVEPSVATVSRSAGSPSSPLAMAAKEASQAAMTGEGALVGQVLSDATGLPVAGATVTLSPSSQTAATDEAGRYRFVAPMGAAVLGVEKDGMAGAERSVVVQEAAGVVAIDARLTPLAEPHTITPAGGSLAAEFPRRLHAPDAGTTAASPAALALTVPAGALTGSSSLRLTALSPQGVTGLLPLGYSPIMSFDLRGSAAPTSSTAHVTGLPSLTLHLVKYDGVLHDWIVVAPSLQADDGALDVALSGLGAWALVAPDPTSPPLPVPSAGGTLTAAAFQAIPEAATSRNFADPPSMPASGGTSHGRIEVDTSQTLPSGTVVQAVLNETYRLTSGNAASGEQRYEDILLYRADLEGLVLPEAGATALGSEIPIVASRQFEATELEEGRVHLDILAGREGVRSVGGSEAVTVTSGDATLQVPAGALPEDTVIKLAQAPAVSGFVPQPPGFSARSEVVVDFSGATLGLAAELSIPIGSSPPGGSFFVARVEAVGSETHLRVVAWAERVGDRIVTRPRAPLPGILQGGRYVVYHAVPSVAFLAGVTRAGAAPVPALVTTTQAPFVGLSGTDGNYNVLTLAGSVRVSARVLGTSLVGTASAELAAGSVLSLDIVVSQALTVASVTPADGATGIPTTRQIELDASAPLDPLSAVPASVALRRSGNAAVLPVRTVLSASGRQLAVIPLAPLAYATSYTFEATGLRDRFGAPVAAPVVTFTTHAQVAETLNLDALRFSYPVNGVVTMTAPAGALPAGSQILVINATTGGILTYSVGDLAISAELRASIADRLWVTVTDPHGNETVFERTEYIGPDGTTAVGAAGGKVRGSDGSEMRLPAGATDGPVTIKVTPVLESELPAGQRPDLPDAHFGAGIQIQSADKPTFKKEVDLAFPKPADAPPGAFFYVYRKITLPGGRVSFETIDQAFVEGDKVVTASFPFGGYTSSFGALGGAAGQHALAGVEFNIAFLMWTFDELMPGRAMAGVITGRVLRAAFDPETREPIYVGIPFATVTGLNDAGLSQLTDPESSNVSSAVSQGDGTFTMVDARYTGGLVGVSVLTPEGETKTGTAYESNPLDSKNYSLRFFRNIADVTVTFDPLEEPPGPAVVDVAVVRLGAIGQRLPTDGLIVEGSRLLVGVRNTNAEVEQVAINGQAYAFGTDPLQYSGPMGFDLITSEEFIASPPGMYRVEVSARGEDNTVRTVTRNFRVVPEGGGNGLPDPESPPEVLVDRTVPRADALGVAVTTLPQIEFSEPVRNIAGTGSPRNVRLYEIGEFGVATLVPARLIGVPPGSQTAVDVTSAAANDQAVVSLVIEAQPGLKYDTKYRIQLTDAILDLDPSTSGGPKPLLPYVTEFKTLTLDAATSQGTFPSPGVVVQDGFAYLVQNNFTNGVLKVFDVRGPEPLLVPSADRSITNRPVDLGIKPKRLVVGTAVTTRSLPSNIHVFDVNAPDDPRWVGVASISNGVLDGYLQRLVVRGNYVYALAERKGVQTVDLRVAEQNFVATGGPSSPAYWQMIMRLNTDGQGFGMDAVVSTIPFPVNQQFNWYLHDLDAGNYVVNGRTEPVVFLGAEDRRVETCSFIAASPLTASVLKSVELRLPDLRYLCPFEVALGRVAGREVAVLGVGLGRTRYTSTGWGLAVVDVSNPLNPILLSFMDVDLPDISDVVLDGDQALVASRASGTHIVNLDDPEAPYVAGHVDNLSGRLAVAEGPIYYSAGGTYADAPEGGLHVADVDPQCDLLSVRDEALELSAVRDPLDNTYCGGGDVLAFKVCQPSRVTLRIGGTVPELSLDDGPNQSLADIPLSPGWHWVKVPWGTIGTGLDAKDTFTLHAQSQIDPSRQEDSEGTIRNKILNRAVFPVGHTFIKGVDLLDGHVVRQSTDIKVEGRHLGLEVTRTYSSAGVHEDGTLGASWGWNYDAAVSPMGCGLVNVSTADGGSQVFKLTGQGYKPQPGYHTRLNRLGDGSFEFIDKSGVRHYYREPVDPFDPEGPRRLDRIVEPHGDRVEVAYDLLGRVSSVREVLRGERAVRNLDLRYRRVSKHDRVISVESNLGHRVDYDYDDYGNLVSAVRSGQNVDDGPNAEPATERYDYTTDSLFDPHQLKAARGPSGDRTEYAYYEAADNLPGEAAALLMVGRKQELAKRVTEFANSGPEPEPQTTFAFDFSQANGGVYTTKVTDPRANETIYTLNASGSPTRILEPLGKETVTTWVPLDILKESETDAEGRVTRFFYEDGLGNLTKERIEKDGTLLAETVYTYHPEFGKLTYKRDPEGRETFYQIGPLGDLERLTDAENNITIYHYDADGQLDWERDPRSHTTSYGSFNDFGSPRQIQNALGQATTRDYDSRNRVTRERQEPYGRETRTTFDGFDRPVTVVKLSGQPGGDERTEIEYRPGGEISASVNALNGRTEYSHDGMNRVIATSMQVGNETLTTAMEYDGNGNKVMERDRRAVVRRHHYDALNRLDETQIENGPGGGPTGVVARFGYSPVGNKLWEKDQAGRQTDYEYDGLYRVKTKKLPASMPAGFTPAGRLQEEYAYDRVGNRTSTKDANGHITIREYDRLNRVERVLDPEGRETVTVYQDPEGSRVNKRSETESPRGLVTEYEYDALNRETARTVRLTGEDGDPQTSNVSHRTETDYEDADHAQLIKDANDKVTRVELDGLDREIVRIVDVGGLNLRTETDHDGAGNKTEQRDPRSNPTNWSYDALNRLLSVRDAYQQETTYDYDGTGLLSSETDRRGVKTRHTYDNLGRPRTSVLDNTPFSGVGWSQEIQYVDAAVSLRREIDARNNTTVYELDGLDRVVKETDPAGKFIQTTWDGVNRRIIHDKRGNSTRYDYDDANRVVRVTDPPPFDTQTVETAFDDAANATTETDRRDIVKVTQMDALGRVVKVTRAGVVLERSSYDGVGNKVLAVDGEGKKTQFVYDGANRLSRQTDGFESAEAATTEYRYDQSGNKITVIDPRSTEAAPSERFLHDALNRLTDEWDGEGNNTHYGYDAEGNQTSRREPKLMTTTFTYDELGKLLTLTQPAVEAEAPLTRHFYDAARNRTRQVDARGNVVEMRYDALNRLDKTTQDPGGLNLVTETLAFDANGNPEQVRDPQGQITTTVYDELNRVQTVTPALPEGSELPWRHTTSTRYEYDENGNLQRIEEHVASGSDPPGPPLVSTRAYDDQDRLQSETQALPDGGSRTVAYAYYANGLRKTVTDPAGSVTLYTYDGQNRLRDSVTGFGTPDAKTTVHSYWPDGLPQTVTSPNGVVASYSYDGADRLTSLVNSRSGATISSYAYGYDDNGNRLTQIEVNGGASESTSYGYDALDRLESVTYPGGTVVGYDYDAVGNRTGETERNSAGDLLSDKRGAFDNANRLTSLTDLTRPEGDPARVTSFTWDANGNQLTKTENGVTTRYQYDWRDKLAEVGQGTSILGRYQYDFEGRRSKKIGEEGVRQYVYDESSLFAEYDDSGALKAKYEYGSDRLISLVRPDEPRRYFSFDGLGSVVNLTDDAGLPAANYHLDAWGGFRFPSELTASKNPFGFTGHFFDRETGLYDAKARFYDPHLGRFLSQDTFLGAIDDPPSLHRYAYAHNAPTVFVDPTGHYIESAIEIASIGVGAYSLRQNVKEGNWWSAAGDVLGIAVDAVALAIPLLPGGAGLAIKASRAYKVAKAIDLANNTGQAIGAAAENYAEGNNATGAFHTAMAVMGLRGVGRAASEIAEDASKTASKSANLSEAQKASRVAESPAGEAAAARPAAKAESAAKPVADSAAPPPPQKLLPAGDQPRALIGPAGDPGMTKAAQPGGARFIADADGNVKDFGTGRGNLNPIGEQGPIELGPAPRGEFQGPWRELPGKGFSWKRYLENATATKAPSEMPHPHAHHILPKRGTRSQRALVAEGQAILRRSAGIDPIYGTQNLTWAPNRVKGQHSTATIRAIVEKLRALEQAGASPDEFAQALQEFGKAAARRR